MSVSLLAIVVALPIALTTRAVMGEEKFNQWIQSSEYVLTSDFTSMDEMKRVVCASGYDVTTFMNSPKTHFSKENNAWFLWEVRDGKIVAVMSIHDNKSEINSFISAVEKKAGHKVFTEAQHNKESGLLSGSSSKQVGDAPRKSVIKETIPTVFVDQVLLKQVLEKFNIVITSERTDHIECKLGAFTLSFTKEGNEAFDLAVCGEQAAMKSFYDCLFAMNEEYGVSVQEQTYLHVLSTLNETGMTLVEENVLEDNSIVLTLQVNEQV